MRAPLLTATLLVAGGMALALLRPVPAGGGPLLLALAVAGLAVSAAVAVAAVAPSRTRSGGAPSGPWTRRADRWLLPGLLLLAGGLLGAARRTEAVRSCTAGLPSSAPVRVSGTVVDVVGERGRLRVDTVRIGTAAVACGDVLPVRWDGAAREASADEAARPGTPVAVQGRWWRPPGSSGAGARGLLLVDSLRVLPAAPRHGARGSATVRLRALAAARLRTLYPEQHALAASLLLARREGLDPDVRDRFARAGLSHLLAISGLHVGLVAGALLLLASLLRLGKRPGALLAGAGTVAYVAFLGAPDSAARAALQIVLLLAARVIQRPTRTESTMAAAALLLLAADPLALTRPGFQMSFAGVAGILALRRPLLDAAPRWSPRWLADGLATSLAATAATAPIAAWHFGRVAPVGVLANLVAIPLLGLAIPGLALSLLVGAAWIPAGRFLAGPPAALLDAIQHTAAVAAAVPGGTVAVPGPRALELALALAAGYAASRRLGRVRVAVRRAVWTGFAAALLVIAPLRPAVDHVEIHMIDVGQGDALALRSPAGRWILVDAGVGGQGFDAGARLVVPYLTRHGARRLEGLILTHPDADHTGGAEAVVRSLHPRWIGDPAAVVGKGLYLHLLQAADDHHIPWIALRRGVDIELDGMRLDVLSPPARAGPTEDANQASVVLRLRYGEFTALLTGDAPTDVEERLVRHYGDGLRAEVLKVGHHGSATSSAPSFLAATRPSVALISVGAGNRYGHPDPDVVTRLRARRVHVYRSDQDGTVVVRGAARGLRRVETERREP